MRAQFLGIYFSLMVHGISAILLFGISQELPPAVKTVVLDFSLDSGGRMGEDGSGKSGLAGGDEAGSQTNTPFPMASPGDRKIESSMEPPLPLPDIAAPPPLISEKRPSVVTKPPPLPEETRPALKKPPPTRQVLRDDTPKIVKKKPLPKNIQRKAVLREKAVKPLPDPKAKPKPPVQTAKKRPAPAQVDSRTEKKQKSSPPIPKPAKSSHSRSTVPGVGLATGPDRSAESRTNDGVEMPAGLSEYPVSGSRNGPAINGAGFNGVPSGDGGSTYLKSHFNFIRGRLRAHLCYPSIARERGWRGKVMVSFTIYPDGRAENIEVQKSCGISLLDKSALKTVHNASPFPSPPMAARIVVPIVYQLN